MQHLDSLQFLREIISQTKGLQNNIAVFIVANTKQALPNNDYLSSSITTEYFSETELEAIVNGFRNSGFYTDISIGEDQFIKKIQNGLYHDMPFKNKIVYNSAQTGTGPGRKSLIPSFCNLHQIPITGSNAYVGSLCRHKYHYCSLLKHHHLQHLKAWLFYYKTGWLLSEKPPGSIKVIAKPIYESASIGVTEESVLVIDNNFEERIVTLSKNFDQPIIIQEFIAGFEVEVPLFNDSFITHSLGCVGISLNGNALLGDSILTYDVVYDDKYAFFDISKVITEEVADRIIKCAIDSANVLGIEGFGRIDFRITEEGAFYITDIATNPHITPYSSFSYLFELHEFDYKDLPVCMLALAAKKYEWI